MEVTNDSIMLKKKAVQKPLTEKPGTISLANKIIAALMISKNKPRVKMVIGIVSITSTGFRMEFKTESTIATRTPVTADSICTPGKINEVIITANALTTN